MTHHDDPQRMPRGTYPVELRCRCKRTARYFSTTCPDRPGHVAWDALDHYGESTPDGLPDFEEAYMRAAREYHAAYMAEVARLRALREAS
jgi:hypothetical protein